LDKHGASASVLVRTTTIDDIADELNLEKIDIIKLNIEGAEIEALEGARKALKLAREVLIAAHHIRNGELTAPRVARIVKSSGYRVEIVHGPLARWYVVARR
jgi:hypothetical protein